MPPHVHHCDENHAMQWLHASVCGFPHRLQLYSAINRLPYAELGHASDPACFLLMPLQGCMMTDMTIPM
jgi:hypothetical protein